MYRLVLLAAAFSMAAPAATLEKLTLDDMIAKSTEIVRAKVTSTSSSFRGNPTRGGLIYTHYMLQVSERYKGSAGAMLDVAVPGGVAQGYRQVIAGSPTLNQGDDYVFFLWTSRSGLTQIIGLTQGLFTLSKSESGKQILNRTTASEVMLEAGTGKAVTDSGMTIGLAELKQRIEAIAGKAAQ